MFIFPEGATPLSDGSGLIPKWVYTLVDLNRVEAENILGAQKKYLQPPKLTSCYNLECMIPQKNEL